MKKYKIKKGLISQKNDAKTTIFDGEKSTLYTFNETASFIFWQIKLKKDEKQIIENLTKRFETSKKTAKKDFDDFIATLRKKKIIS